MANYSAVIQVCFFLLAYYICLTAGTNLESRFLQLEKNFVNVKEALRARVVTLETKVTRLEAKVEQQESQIAALILKEREKDQSSSTKKFTMSVELNQNYKRNAIFRTCQELRSSNPLLESGMYWIDPDGQGVGDDAIHVLCDMKSGKTSIGHDSESKIHVEKCAEPGCFSRKINYYATDRQIESLIGLSDNCNQTIKINCNNAPLNVGGVAYSWYNTNNKKYDGKQTFSWLKNCDSGGNTQDDGYWPSAFLPITRLHFGGTLKGSLQHTLGKIECEGKAKSEGMPKSCEDLWRIGHTLNGIFAVKGSKSIESLYCDFNRRPNENGFQKWIGYADVKSAPVHFHVTRNSDSETQNTPIPFSRALVNEGNAMDLTSGKFTAPLPGIYFFSFAAVAYLKDSSYVDFYSRLFLNGNLIGSSNVHENNAPVDQVSPLTLQMTLNLKKGDRVWVEIVYYGSYSEIESSLKSSYLSDGSSHFTHFTGFMLEEEIAASL
ncbi:uncharacterized protein LOC124203952 [Daphnia pulex]|uniref:uncharacterized protein LOC124203952 n=1 Tax=Daphnia pulex TaxID=6669 RepID=UPI001EDDC352|nr:uncharacterized protein LOC124203952 [Daphnia pulex]